MFEVDNSHIKILVVDDTPENLEIAGTVLEENNYDVYAADSGAVALELLENTLFDLILLDIMMPGMDGFETFQQIRKNEQWKDIPVIFLTAKVDIESIVKGFKYGAVDYIKKPFNSLELAVRVKNHVELKKIREELGNKNKMLEESQVKLEHLATTDELTGLLNRREIKRLMEYEKNRFDRNGKDFSIILGDIDFFKKVNDNYGHDCGDYILKEVSEIITETIRKQDYLCRWGGEEMLILMPESGGKEALAAAERIRKDIESAVFRYNSKVINVTITLGIAVFSGEGTIEKLIDNADKAMYKGKTSGRNQVVLWRKSYEV